MLTRKPIPTIAAKPKRGTMFRYMGNIVFLYHIPDMINWVVSDTTDFEAVYKVPVDSLIAVAKPRHAIISRPKAKTTDDSKWETDLNEFFLRMATKCPHDCENCGQPLNIYTQESKRLVTAHILPKSRKQGFPGVATNEHNIMFLGVYCGCHDQWDKRGASERQAMDIYSTAIERYNKFKQLLSEKDIIRAEKYL